MDRNQNQLNVDCEIVTREMFENDPDLRKRMIAHAKKYSTFIADAQDRHDIPPQGDSLDKQKG